MIYGVWLIDKNDWLKHGKGILAYTDKAAAEIELASFFGYHTYESVVADGWGEVRELKEAKSDQRCVHTEHCDYLSCKYGEEESCPVYLGLKEPSHPQSDKPSEAVFARRMDLIWN